MYGRVVGGQALAGGDTYTVSTGRSWNPSSKVQAAQKWVSSVCFTFAYLRNGDTRSKLRSDRVDGWWQNCEWTYYWPKE